jgi:outer membrane murein-binding lipoprotein Lpp
MSNNTMVKDEKAATYVIGSGKGWQAISPVRPDSKSPDSKSPDSSSDEDGFFASCLRGDHKKPAKVKDTVYVPGPQSSGCDQPKFEKDHAAQRVEALQATVADLQAKVAALQAKVAALQAERDLKRKRG